MIVEYISKKQKQDIFSHYQCIEKISDFEEWREKIEQSSSKYYYRGVNEAKYKNYTSAQRFCMNHNKQELPLSIVCKELNKMRHINNNLVEKYCISMDVECTDLFLMSLAQHYKGISLYLDFTTSLNTALYFTCQKQKSTKSQSNLDKISLNNYVSLYYYPFSNVRSFEQLTDEISKQCSFSLKNDDETTFNKSALYTFKTLLSLGKFDILFGRFPIMIENKSYPFNLSHKNKTFSKMIIISNLNILAQEGCLLYYNNANYPLEEKLSCIDIHKSLIPLLKRRYLLPNGKCENTLFPSFKGLMEMSLQSLV